MNPLSNYLVRQVWKPPSRRILAGRLEEYLAEIVAPGLGVLAKEAAANSEFIPVHAGRNTLVRRWEHPALDGPLYVRAWPWDGRKRPARQHAIAGKMLAECGLRVPKVVHIGDDFATMRRWRMEVAVEEAAAGAGLNRDILAEAEVRRSVAEGLARLHGRAGVGWGAPWVPAGREMDPREYWRTRMKRFRERITEETTALSSAQIRHAIETLEKGLAAYPIDRPSLIHGDPSMSHAFLDDAGDLTWIDFETVEFGAPEQDFAALRHSIRDPEIFGDILAEYMKATEGFSRITERSMRTFWLLFLLEKLNSRVQKLRHRREEKGEASGEDSKSDQWAKELKKTEALLIEATES